MRRDAAPLTFLIAISVAVGTVVRAQSAPLSQPADARGGLLFIGLVGGRGAGDAQLARLDPAVRSAYVSALKRRLALRPLRLPPDVDDKQPGPARLDFRATLIALGQPEAVDEATAYAGEAEFWWEWEAVPDGPLTEATYAETYLRRAPGSALRPVLTVFLMHRYRAAFEAASLQLAEPSGSLTVRGEMEQAHATARRGYLQARTDAYSIDDPLVRALARDIDEGTFVYIERQPHPGR